MKERHELHCHNCSKYVRFDLNMMDGQHILNCPNCGHQHFRIIKNGIITSDRWGQDPSQNIQTYIVGSNTTTWSNTSAYSNAGTGGTYLVDSWMKTSTAC